MRLIALVEDTAVAHRILGHSDCRLPSVASIAVA
jgi:hypothetical protein